MCNLKRQEKELFPSKRATIGTRGRYENRKGQDKFRTEYQRDVHRIIYSQAFRRLRHKTQVFYFPQNDHVSTRLDHVIFVAAAARTVARCLRLNEDLAEAIGLAHDIGHPPFGHQGEEFLTEIIVKNSNLKKYFPAFHHEVYGLRVVDKLAMRDRERPGLDLTWEVRDGIISHCGEDFKKCKLEPKNKHKNLEAIRRKEEAGNPATLEGCIVRMIDKIVYFGKDIEDAIASETIEEKDIPEKIIEELGNTNGQIIGTFVEDMVKNSYDKDYIAISSKLGDLLHRIIKKFNEDKIYHSGKSEGYRDQAKQNINLLFKVLLDKLQATNRLENFNKSDRRVPDAYKIFHDFLHKDMKGCYDEDPDELIVLDFVAGMTDSFAVRSFQELFIPQATV